ncbi:hypothetical protein Patl1_11926 [Pistacia atlantica]|uniref:Uncharacterized protein n=1 Tax=Pistacia atlantica TaxID=434234 RepID=A0ACC1A1Z8_9ROSI|nr:hypothetical protein Patl1_11926 [Pistacia atlantica]
MASTNVRRIMTCTFCILFLYFFNLIFRFLQSVSDFLFWGFDEYMNLVLDDAEEVHIKKKTRKSLEGSDDSSKGRFILALRPF